MKRKIVSLIAAIFAMAITCAAAFADTVTFDKKNKGKEKDFVTMEFNSVEELQTLCKKYKKNNAEVLLKADSPLVKISGFSKPEFLKIVDCFPGSKQLDVNEFSSLGILNVDLSGVSFSKDVSIEFKYDGKSYSLGKISPVEVNTVSFLNVQFSENDIAVYSYFCSKVQKGLWNQQKSEFHYISEFEKLYKKHKLDTFYMIIPAGSKIRNEKELENLSKIIYGDSSKLKKDYKGYFDSDKTIVIESYVKESDYKGDILDTLLSLDAPRRVRVYAGEKDSSILTIEKEILDSERKKNEQSGFGKLTDAEVEKERNQNEAAGYGRLTNAEVKAKLDYERKVNERAGLGKLTNAEVSEERKRNEAAGKGRLTNEEILNAERAANKKAGLGNLTNAEVEKERKSNETAGYGRITNVEVEKERTANEKAGLGKLTNAEVEKERTANETAGFGRLTNAEVEKERVANEKVGFGRLTNVEVEKERLANEKAGLGRLTNVEVTKKILPDGYVFVEGGTFQMGQHYWDGDYDLDYFELKKVYKAASVESFIIGKTEVTQKLYESVMGKNPSSTKGVNKPVQNVSWYDALEFCNALSKRDGLTPCYTKGTDGNWKWNQSANGWRLPTEAEWQFAAKGGNKSKGYEFSGSNNEDDVAWNYYDELKDVATKSPNEIGLYDMSGNVEEWCWEMVSCGVFFIDLGGYRHVSGVEHEGMDWSFKPTVTSPKLGFRIVRSLSDKENVFSEYVKKINAEINKVNPRSFMNKIPKWMANSEIVFTDYLYGSAMTIGDLFSDPKETTYVNASYSSNELKLSHKIQSDGVELLNIDLVFKLSKRGDSGTCYISKLYFENVITSESITLSCYGSDDYGNYTEILGTLSQLLPIMYN